MSACYLAKMKLPDWWTLKIVISTHFTSEGGVSVVDEFIIVAEQEDVVEAVSCMVRIALETNMSIIMMIGVT